MCALLALASAGCGQPGDPGGVAVEIGISPTPPMVGATRIIVSVGDASGSLEGATVEIVGTGPGGGERRRTAGEEGDGRYSVSDFPFDVRGEWKLEIEVVLPDGRAVRRSRSVSVVGAP